MDAEKVESKLKITFQKSAQAIRLDLYPLGDERRATSHFFSSAKLEMRNAAQSRCQCLEKDFQAVKLSIRGRRCTQAGRKSMCLREG